MKTIIISLFSLAITVNAQKATSVGKSKTFSFKAKLTEEVSFPPGCGTMAWAVVHKFEVIETTSGDYENRFVLVAEPCPEFKGKSFFKKGAIYKLECSTTSNTTFEYALSDRYKKANLPLLWSTKTERVKN